MAFRLRVAVGLMAATPYSRRLLLQLLARLQGPPILAVVPHSVLLNMELSLDFDARRIATCGLYESVFETRTRGRYRAIRNVLAVSK